MLSTVPQLLLALGLAHLLNYRLRGRTLFRMGVLLPNVTSVAAVTIIFVQLFGRDYGLINWVLGLFGVRPRGLAGRYAAPPGSPSRSSSPGAGPATTR